MWRAVPMGSRTLPTECHHGTIIDWGDFGPCDDCAEHGWDADCPNFADCEECAAEQVLRSDQARQALVQALHEQLDNDVRVTKHTGATRSLSEWERDDIVASVLRVLDEKNASSSPPVSGSPVGDDRQEETNA